MLCRRFVLLVALTVVFCACVASAQTTLTISAAASLKEALAETETAYKQSHANVEFRNNLGSSGTLAAQIDQGAPADVFLSAAAKPMDELEAKGLIVAGTRRNLLRNSLVQAFPQDSMDGRRCLPFTCWTSSTRSWYLRKMSARF
jgi:molybdate transport system substrate-binding protein